MNIHKVKELLQRYQAGSCTSSEKELVESWYQRLIETGEWQWDEGEKDMVQDLLETRIMKQINDQPNKLKSTVFLFPRTRWWAAASVILLMGVFSYFLLFNKKAKPVQSDKVLSDDIRAPLSNRAMITLASGQRVYLDSVGNGALAVQGNVKLVKLAGGEIAYLQSMGEVSGKMEYNTLSNPRGSKLINMTLSDGSKAWLNAGSSLTYPVLFIGNERKVSMTGEAYFEVIHDASKPFIVNNGSMNVRVLGTHFNVNTYEDEAAERITLLEGSVRVSKKLLSQLLKPGQQASASNNEINDIKVVNDVNMDEVMAWKNGKFRFGENTDIGVIMRQISRWYDVDIEYHGKVKQGFWGSISKNVNASKVLKILEATGGVKFKVEGNKIIVMPGS